MKGRVLSRLRLCAGTILAVSALAATGLALSAACAQGATDSTSAAAPVASVEEANPSLGLIPLRPQGEITTSINAAKVDVGAIEIELAPARERAVVARGRLNIQRGELQTTESRMKLAKQIKNAAEMATLRPAIDKDKREVAYLARTEDAMRADVSRLEAERDAAKATVAMYERELELAMLRTSPGITGADPRFPDLVRRTLEAMKAAADRRADAAPGAKAVAERQITQLKALDRMAAPVK